MSPLGEVVRCRRIGRELTQKQLATLVGMHPQIVSNVERGVMNLPLKHSKKMRQALGIAENRWHLLVTRDLMQRTSRSI